VSDKVERGKLRIHAAALRYFDAVRAAGSIREAARRLNVASSAVNRQILGLEAEIGHRLFERLPSGLKLTSAGEVVARHVIGVLRDAERLESELDDLRGLRGGHVELLTLEGFCHRIVPQAVAAMRAQAPRVTVGVGIGATEVIPDAILDGEAHLGLAFEVPPRPELRRLAVARFTVGAVVEPNSPLASRESITPRDCRDQVVILPKSNFANRRQLHPVLWQAGMTARARYESGSIELMKQLVLRGLGVALMTKVGVEAELLSGRLVHVPLRHGRGMIHSELGLYARAASALPIAAEVFAVHVGEAMAASAASGDAMGTAGPGSAQTEPGITKPARSIFAADRA
jgi:DNA-binding transcriptional LysR family regulator